jgi:hypothetical protein
MIQKITLIIEICVSLKKEKYQRTKKKYKKWNLWYEVKRKRGNRKKKKEESNQRGSSWRFERPRKSLGPNRQAVPKAPGLSEVEVWDRGGGCVAGVAAPRRALPAREGEAEAARQR